MSQESAQHLFQVYKTVHEMLNDRGYVVQQAILDMHYDQFYNNPGLWRAAGQPKCAKKLKKRGFKHEIRLFIPNNCELHYALLGHFTTSFIS